MKKSTKKLLKNGYPGTVKLGRTSVIFGFVGCLIIGLGLIAGGIILLVAKPPDDDKLPELKKSQKIGIKIIAGFMIGFALLIILFSGLRLYFATRYKAVAAAEGVGTIYNLFL